MDEPMDRLLKASQVAELEGLSKRWLMEYVRKGLFPPPDIPAQKRGDAARWFESTVRRARAERLARLRQQKDAAAHG